LLIPPLFVHVTDSSFFVAEPHMRFESNIIKKLPEINPAMIGPGDFSGNNLHHKKKGIQPVS